MTRKTLSYIPSAIKALEEYKPSELMQGLKADALVADLKKYQELGEKVVSQAHRRIVLKEQVPTADKIVSIFEDHTDIIVKGFRDVVFGHKVCLTTGRSNLILSCSILDGNPADSTLVDGILTKHEEIFKKAPEQTVYDGCFGSVANRDLLKERGVKDTTFCKNRSIDLASLVSSLKLHKILRNFRAGIEGCISFIKRTFGLSRILDRTEETFKAAVQSAVAAYNLTLLARYRIAQARMDAA